MWHLEMDLTKFVAFLTFLVCVKGDTSRPCNEMYAGWEGNIMSPQYPLPYPSSYSCSYYLLPPRDNLVVNITVEDLDLEQDQECLLRTMGSCCTHTWLSVPKEDVGGSRSILQLCGRNETLRHRVFSLTVLRREALHIKFHSLGNHNAGRGFLMRYKYSQIPVEDCEEGQIKCDNGKCVLQSWLCDGIPQCADGKDEYYCATAAYTFTGVKGRCQGIDEAECGPLDSGCFNNKTQRCDGRRDCRQSGLDEDGCEGCKKGTMPCVVSHGCYHISEACDGTPHCSDFTDEADCDYCPPGQAVCSLQSPQCFTPFTDRCNGKPDCPFGEDEVGCDPMCENSIACADGLGCYTPAQRCNLLMNCADGSDEMHCQHELHFECQTGGNSISVRLWCDGVDDCGDGSDERGCIKNSVITAAIMGSLLCGLLLVVAVGCTCRLYSLSMKGLGGSSNNNNSGSNISSSPHHNASPVLSPAPPSSPRHDLAPLTAFPGDEEFYFREPPPAYSVAVGECPPSPCPPYTYTASNQAQPRIHSVLPGCERVITRTAGRRSRRNGSGRRHSLTPSRPPAGQPVAPPLPLPPYSAMLRGLHLPPYSPSQDPNVSSSAEVSVPDFAPPPSLKVMESLLQSIEREVDAACSVDAASDAAALVGMDSSEPCSDPCSISGMQTRAASVSPSFSSSRDSTPA